MDWWLTLAGLIIGVVVGMTGMGGGALMTPVLVLFFGIPPLSAVSNDLVVSAVTKPVGGLVHLKQGTVNLPLAGWLSLGSVPFAFCGVFISRALGPGAAVQSVVKYALGAALLVASTALIVKAYFALVERARRRREGYVDDGRPAHHVDVRPVPTVLIGAVGGLVVGMTSVGSGSLMIVALLALYPRLQASSLVGTDLVQSVPLVFSAALGHVLFGDFQVGVTFSLLVGCLPGTFLGAMMSSRMPGGIVRRALALVLLASGLKLLEVGNLATVLLLAAALVLGSPLWIWLRRRYESIRPLAPER